MSFNMTGLQIVLMRLKYSSLALSAPLYALNGVATVIFLTYTGKGGGVSLSLTVA